jgi:hypothetical protein
VAFQKADVHRSKPPTARQMLMILVQGVV